MQRTESDMDILDSWKEISGYLHRDIRTIQRWERERSLPVRRMPGGEKARVYAVKSELDAWRRNRGIHVASERGAEAEPASPESIAVLPFLTLSSSLDDQYFGDGLADEIITALSGLPGLRVTARTSSFAFRGKDRDIREIGRRLNAKAVLEGSVRRAGNRVRVTAQLVEAETGYLLWSERFDQDLTDVFSIQDAITRAIVAALRVKLTHAFPRIAPPAGNKEAYQFWLKGRYHTQRQTPEEIVRSRGFFEQAIALDPGCARAHLGLAESWWEGAFFGIDSPREAVAIGRPAVLKALEIDPTLGEAHAMLGMYLGVHDFDWLAAEREFRRGLECSPGSSEVRTRYAAWLLEPNGRLAEARAQLDLALELDPLSPVIHGCVGHNLIFQRKFELAAEEVRLAVELEPSYWVAHILLAGAYGFMGMFDKAIAACEEVLEPAGANPLLIGSYGCLLGLVGNRRRAEELREQLIQSSRGYFPALTVAWIHLGLGEAELCLDWLEKGVEERHPLIVEFKPKPFYDGLRAHPRFQALLSTMGLAT